MKLPVLLLVLLALTGCGDSELASDSSKIKDSVRGKLNDPGSAEFKEMVISKDGKRACIIWNAKNQMGGYGKWKVAELTKNESKWTLKEMDGLEQNCSSVGFTSTDAGEQAAVASRQRAIEKLQKGRNISLQVATALADSHGQCRGIIWDYTHHAEQMARDNVGTTTGYHYKKMKEIEEHLDAGNCEKIASD